MCVCVIIFVVEIVSQECDVENEMRNCVTFVDVESFVEQLREERNKNKRLLSSYVSVNN